MVDVFLSHSLFCARRNNGRNGRGFHFAAVLDVWGVRTRRDHAEFGMLAFRGSSSARDGGMHGMEL